MYGVKGVCVAIDLERMNERKGAQDGGTSVSAIAFASRRARCSLLARSLAPHTMLRLPSLFGKVFAVIIAVLGTFRMGVGVFAWRAANALERPSYEVVKKLGKRVELRKYDEYLIAETTIKNAPMKKATGKGFQAVAGYIFGKNKPKVKMAMTAPVRTSAKTGGAKMAMTAPVRSESTGDTTKVSFVLEKSYSKRTAPRPLDRSVSVRDVRPHLLAARVFSGKPPTEKRVELEKAKILAALEANGLAPEKGCETMVYGYHDPFITPNFLRRNEVCVRVVEQAA